MNSAPMAGDPVLDVTLREVTADSVRAICGLSVQPGQERFVAGNALSIAQAHFEPRAWFRAIYVGDDPAGFVMLLLDPDKPESWVWRFMVEGRFQRRGVGRAAMGLVVAFVRTLPWAGELRLSYVPAGGNPSPFYTGLGFEETGEVDDGENVMRLVLNPS